MREGLAREPLHQIDFWFRRPSAPRIPAVRSFPMTADAWQGRLRWSRIVVAGGLLAVSLFGMALGIGLSRSQHGSVQLGVKTSIPVSVARACQVSRDLSNETVASLICVQFHLGQGVP